MTTRKRPEKITFDFARSPFFRVVHSNGAWGGITPRRELSVTFFSESGPLPRHITHSVTPEGGLGPEIDRESATNIHRECEVEVLMSMDAAVNLHQWIGAKIEEWRKVDLSIPQNDSSEAS